MALYGYTVNDDGIGDAWAGRWTTTPEGIPVFAPFAVATLVDRPSSAQTLGELLDEIDPEVDFPEPPCDGASCGGCETCDPTPMDIGTCICGAYGRLGGIHFAKPSASEPVEECGTFA